MVKQNQTIRQQQPTNYLSVFEHFVGLAFKGLTLSSWLEHTGCIIFDKIMIFESLNVLVIHISQYALIPWLKTIKT